MLIRESFGAKNPLHVYCLSKTTIMGTDV